MKVGKMKIGDLTKVVILNGRYVDTKTVLDKLLADGFEGNRVTISVPTEEYFTPSVPVDSEELFNVCVAAIQKRVNDLRDELASLGVEVDG